MEFFRLQEATFSDAQIGTLLAPTQSDWSWVDGLDAQARGRVEEENRALRLYLASEVRDSYAEGLDAAQRSLGTEFFRYRLGCASRQLASAQGAASRDRCAQLALAPLR
jgi:hypothetical protein